MEFEKVSKKDSEQEQNNARGLLKEQDRLRVCIIKNK